MALDAKRPTVYSDVWSHQLGARGLHRQIRALVPAMLRSWSRAPVARRGRRRLRARQSCGRPAHVEALGGRVVGGPLPVSAKASVRAPADVSLRARGAPPLHQDEHGGEQGQRRAETRELAEYGHHAEQEERAVLRHQQ